MKLNWFERILLWATHDRVVGLAIVLFGLVGLITSLNCKTEISDFMGKVIIPGLWGMVAAGVWYVFNMIVHHICVIDLGELADDDEEDVLLVERNTGLDIARKTMIRTSDITETTEMTLPVGNIIHDFEMEVERFSRKLVIKFEIFVCLKKSDGKLDILPVEIKGIAAEGNQSVRDFVINKITAFIQLNKYIIAVILHHFNNPDKLRDEVYRVIANMKESIPIPITGIDFINISITKIEVYWNRRDPVRIDNDGKKSQPDFTEATDSAE
jgi:hypothetical protein